MTSSLVIRCDASPRLGIGHLMRCLVLADAWRAEGGRSVFAMQAANALGHDRVIAAGHELVSLAGSEDPAHLIELADRTGARWAVIDHYELDDRYLARLAAASLGTVAIDDLAAHPFPVDVLVNPSPDAAALGYQTAPATRRLLGPRFAPVRDAYRGARPPRPTLERPLEAVMISLGGSDPDDRTEAIVSALARVARPLRVEVVLGPGYAGQVRERTVDPHAILVRRDLADLVDPMRNCQLVIGAGGSTAWEACCLGRPMILWPFVANQRGLAASLVRAGAALEATSADEIAAQIARLDAVTLGAMAGAAWDLVDGEGAGRIVEAMA